MSGGLEHSDDVPGGGVADRMVEANRRYGASFVHGGLSALPSRHVAVVTCMDARLEPLSALGLDLGEAHVIRNAGGVVTDDVIRSLCLSQRSLGTREIVVMHHTRCGLHGMDEAGFRADLQRDVGTTPSWSFQGFDDVDEDVRQSVERLRASPFVPFTEHVSGFVYDVEDGLLRIIEVPDDVPDGAPPEVPD